MTETKLLLLNIYSRFQFIHFFMQFHVCSPGVLKDYLRELPYPLITKHLYEAVLESMATRPLRMGASGCENEQADSEHTVSLLDSLPEVEKVRTGGAGHVDHRCDRSNPISSSTLHQWRRSPSGGTATR